MRKRVVTGLIAVLAAVIMWVAASVLSKPAKGTAEWHQRELAKARDDFLGNTLPGRAKRVFYEVFASPQPDSDSRRIRRRKRLEEMSLHRAALLRLGYFVESRIAITNKEVSRVVAETMVDQGGISKLLECDIWIQSGTNEVIVIARPIEILGVERALRKADFPPRDMSPGDRN